MLKVVSVVENILMSIYRQVNEMSKQWSGVAKTDLVHPLPTSIYQINME